MKQKTHFPIRKLTKKSRLFREASLPEPVQSDTGQRLHSSGAESYTTVAVSWRVPSSIHERGLWTLVARAKVGRCCAVKSVKKQVVMAGSDQVAAAVAAAEGGRAGQEAWRLRGCLHGSLLEQGPAAFCGADNCRLFLAWTGFNSAS